MVVEFKAVEAIGSLVELLRAADSQAVHCWEQDEPFHTGVFTGLILLARLAADRAGEEFRQATTAAELTRWNANLRGERDHLLQRLTEVTAERDAARQQVAELTRKVGELPAEPALGWKSWKPGHVITHRDGSSITLTGENIDNWARWHRHGWRLAEPAPEPYPWQVGDEIEDDGGVRRLVTDRDAKGWVFIRGNGGLPQFEWERAGWKLHRKALPRLTPRHVPLDEDLPDIEPMTPQQVAEFAAVTEPIDDSVGADGEGQS